MTTKNPKINRLWMWAIPLLAYILFDGYYLNLDLANPLSSGNLISSLITNGYPLLAFLLAAFMVISPVIAFIAILEVLKV